jgi:hypothetical protein
MVLEKAVAVVEQVLQQTEEMLLQILAAMAVLAAAVAELELFMQVMVVKEFYIFIIKE